ncbi:MAG: hypothetical protein R3245_03885, partial [Kiloniellales bacterium]|nr:hypothetical protein [Kiloniellales bacterium]
KSSEIVYKKAFCLMNCLVLDLSENGARLRPDDAEACPEVFLLRLTDGVCHVCSVAWREDQELGVMFVAQLG